MGIIEEWQDMLLKKYGKFTHKNIIIECILSVSKKYNMEIESAIKLVDKTIRGNDAEHDWSTLGHLQNFRNSCYMDSVLFALLAIPNKFIWNMLTKRLTNEMKKCSITSRYKIQSELVNIKRAILKGEKMKCVELRNLIANCKLTGFEDFNSSRPQDADEFLKYIFQILEEENFKYKITNNGSTDLKNFVKISSNDVCNASPVIDISLDVMNKISSSTTAELLKIPETGKLDKPIVSNGKKYDHISSQKIFLNYDYMVVHLPRAPFKKIIPSSEVNKLKLSSIVIWEGGHYYSYVNCGTTWWLFDDLKNDLKKIGNYNELIKIPKISTHSVLVFYV